MNSIKVYVEVGKKKTFASAMDWPGWSRGSRDEGAALGALFDYGPRYARVLAGTGVAFQAPADASAFEVIERHEGNSTTDFGAPAIGVGNQISGLKRLGSIRVSLWIDGLLQVAARHDSGDVGPPGDHRLTP